MTRIATAIAGLSLLIGLSVAAFGEEAQNCMAQAKAKKYAGAAQTSFVTKCAQTFCNGQADTKKYAGAARTSFVKKCITDQSS